MSDGITDMMIEQEAEPRLAFDYSDLLGMQQEIIEVLELMHAYGMIHTVKNVKYTNGSHEQAIQRTRLLLEKLRQQT